MVTIDDTFGRASRELECFISQYQDGITSLLNDRIDAANCPTRLQTRYLPFATWEIFSSPDPAIKQEVEPDKEEVVLDLFFNTGFGSSGCYKQLIIRRYNKGATCPHSREVQRQKYIVLQDDRSPVDALQKALNDLPLD